jgi:rhodanese-related sulfurtransferase
MDRFMEHISAQQFLDEAQNAEEKFYILDVRTEAEYKKYCLADLASDNVPLDEVPDVIDTIVNHCQSMRTYVLCKAGKRAEFAAYDLENAGVTNVAVIDGGTMALDALGVAMKPGIMPIERQYHLAMGLLILLGLALDTIILPLIAAISLIFHAITGKCGLIAFIRKLPLNSHEGANIQIEISKSVSAYQEKMIAKNAA